ncbi:MAG: hypothetical protein LAT54_07000 [Cryomorphaceae bacterium]|nr:hypothetical protein [Cryomorphaceae bacterium]
MKHLLYIGFISLIFLSCRKDPNDIDIIIPDQTPPRSLAEQMPGEWSLDAVSYISEFSIDFDGFPLPISNSGTDKNARGSMSIDASNMDYNARYTVMLALPFLPIPSIPVSDNIQFAGNYNISGGNITVSNSGGSRTLEVISHGPYHLTFQTSSILNLGIPLPGITDIPIELTLHYVKDF